MNRITRVCRTGAIKAALILCLGSAALTHALAQNTDSEKTICVTGADGNWSCGPRSNPPKSYPLPDSGVSTGDNEQNQSGSTSSQPRSLDQARYENFLAPLQQTAPSTTPAARPDDAQSLIGTGNFSLRIAEVGTQTDIRELADQFALDPRLIQVAITGSGDNERRVVLLGRFSTPAQSRQAMNGFPTSIRQMRPALERLDSFETVVSLAQLYEPESVATSTAVAPSRTAEPAESTTSPITEASSTASTQPPPRAAEPEPRQQIETPSAVDPVTVVSIDTEGAVSSPASAATTIDADDLTANPEPALPRISATEDSTWTPTPDTDPEVTPEPVRVGSSEPVVAQTIDADSDPDTETDSDSGSDSDSDSASISAERRARNRALSPFRQTAAASDASPPAVATTPARDRRQFEQLDARHYVIQLGNFRTRDTALALMRDARVDPLEYYLIEVDEGAGPRWLLLIGGFESVKSASNRLSSLPGVFRNPWVRRISPLQGTGG